MMNLQTKNFKLHFNRKYIRFDIENDFERIKYEKKHKDLFKKFHTKEGLELANKEAFDNLMKIDTRGEYWKGF